MESSHPRPTVKTGRRALRVLAVLSGLGVVCLLAIWWHMASDKPEVAVPNPVLPNPNGFDFYVAAGNGTVNNKQIDAALYTNPKVPLTLAQKEALLQQNAGVFKAIHDGFAYEYYNPPARSFAALFPHFSNFRRVTRLMALQSQVRSERGDWNGAAESALDAIRVGEDMPRGGVVIALLVGVNCASTGQTELWKTIDHLDAAQAKAATQRLETIAARHVSYADTMQEEKWMGQAGLKETLNKITTSTALSEATAMSGGGYGNEMSAAKRYTMAFYLVYGKKRILQNYTTLMDATIAQARQPYGTKPPPHPVLDPVTEMMAPVFEGTQVVELRSKAQNGLLLLALALHAYRLEQRHYPTTLAELVPTYLKTIPDDPFAHQGSFVYRNEGEKFLLYSLGPDGKDDGGTPIDKPKNATSQNPRSRYRVEGDSKGDMVAGVNM